MGLYLNDNGVLTPIAGRGKAEYGASTIRRGTFSLSEELNDGDVAIVEVTFDTPMPDADYEVILYADSNYPRSSGGLLVMPWARATEKSESYFTALVYNLTGSTISTGFTTAYTAFKLYTDTQYNELVDILDVIPSSASSSNKLMAEDEFIVLPANFAALSFGTGVQQLQVQVANIPAGYKGFGIANWDIGRLDGLNLTGVSVSESGLCRLGIYADKAHSGDLNGTVMCIFRKTT